MVSVQILKNTCNTSAPFTGEGGCYIFLRGENGRLVGTMNFETMEDLGSYLNTFTDDYEEGCLEAVVDYDNENETGGYYQNYYNNTRAPSIEENAEVVSVESDVKEEK